MSKGKIMSIGVCVAAMLALVGCGQAKVPDVVDVTSLVVTDEGMVTSYLVDVFDKDYYSVSGLEAMAVEEAAEYNMEHQTGEEVPLTVEKVEPLEDGSERVVVVHKYNNTDTFMEYNKSILFYGTVSDALNQGYDLDIVLKNVKDDTLFTKDQLLQEPDKYLLITDARAQVYCPGKVTHISEGGAYMPDGTVDTSAAEGTVIILMK